jgi:pimeloyl-ACP methyl ester carboxylesterase
MKSHRKAWVFLAVCVAVILVSSFLASEFQSSWGSVKVTDLRSVTNAGPWAKDPSVTVNGTVVSGLLFVPNGASASNKLPAIVLTHGYLNNRELQLQNAIELSHRGFIVLTIDREAHGNNENAAADSTVFARGIYDAAKYLYNLDYVDQSKIGVSGHSMGGFDTSGALMEDAPNVADLAKSAMGAMTGDMAKDAALTPANGYGLGIISAGLLQAWDNFAGAGDNVSVGILKANDDEFFFGSTSFANPGNTLSDGTPAIARQYLQSVYGAKFVGVSTTGTINIQSDGIYENGAVVPVTEAPPRARLSASSIRTTRSIR